MPPLETSRRAMFRTAVVAAGLLLCAAPAGAQETFLRGDSNADGSLDVSDCVHDLVFLFRDGAPPICLDAADTDDSGSVGIEDPIAVLSYVFLNGTPPPAPGPNECGGDPTADGLDCASTSPKCLDLGRPTFEWEIGVAKAPANHYVVVRAEPRDTGRNAGPVFGRVDLGDFLVIPPNMEEVDGLHAAAEVYATEDAHTYWVRAQAPGVNPSEPESVTMSQASLTIDQYLLKQSEEATLRMVISGASIEMISSPALGHIAEECPGGYYLTLDCCGVNDLGGPQFFTVAHWDEERLKDCSDLFNGTVFIDVAVSVPGLGAPRQIYRDTAYAKIHGFAHSWRSDIQSYGLWRAADFELDPDVSGGGQELHARLALKAPLVVEIPLGDVEVGDVMAMHIKATAFATNQEGRESYASAFFRDPLEADGVTIEFEGLQRVGSPGIPTPDLDSEPAPECTAGADPEAGVIELESAEYFEVELPGIGAPIAITRTGGSKGEVSVRFSTSNGGDPEAPDYLGAALAGADYEDATTHVVFRDGEEGRRVVLVPILTDEEAEPDEQVRLTLSDPRGCAALGERTSAILRIRDDDLPRPVERDYTVGGTVTGFLGSGLVLEDRGAFIRIEPANGPFTFQYSYQTRDSYDVRIISQPTNPLQTCTVTNGAGTIADTDITDILVECITPAPTGGLDPSFGDAGKVTTNLAGGARAIKLLDDGRLLVLGQRALARHLADGSLDAGFGAGGTATVAFAGGVVVEARDVAVQVDGRIVVAGYSGIQSGATTADFAVSRFTADGQLDSGFGTGGTVVTDWEGAGDQAHAILIPNDGTIVVAGFSGSAGTSGSDFAVARYTSSGVLDPGFGSAGKVRTNVAGLTDLGYAAALQADGRIVVAGRAAVSGGANPDVGLARYNTDGTLDATFGDSGIVLIDLTDGNSDEASDVAIQSDGSIVVAVLAKIGAGYDFALARFAADGSLDAGFGTGGLASTDFGLGNDFGRALALDADGRIVVAGQERSAQVDDFGMARYEASGALDPSFGGGGILTVDFFSAADGAYGVAVQPDGKIVVAGVVLNGGAVGLGMLRLVP